jgi:hypothetical protein
MSHLIIIPECDRRRTVDGWVIDIPGSPEKKGITNVYVDWDMNLRPVVFVAAKALGLKVTTGTTKEEMVNMLESLVTPWTAEEAVASFPGLEWLYPTTMKEFEEQKNMLKEIENECRSCGCMPYYRMSMSKLLRQKRKFEMKFQKRILRLESEFIPAREAAAAAATAKCAQTEEALSELARQEEELAQKKRELLARHEEARAGETDALAKLAFCKQRLGELKGE